MSSAADVLSLLIAIIKMQDAYLSTMQEDTLQVVRKYLNGAFYGKK